MSRIKTLGMAVVVADADADGRASAPVSHRLFLQLRDTLACQWPGGPGVQPRFDPFAQALLGQGQAHVVVAHVWDD
jgi:hypothetical protein